MNFKHILPAALVSLAMLTSCGNQKKAETPVGIDLANLDTTAVKIFISMHVEVGLRIIRLRLNIPALAYLMCWMRKTGND